MFQNIIKFSLENRLVVVLASALILILGMFVAFQLPVDVFPDLTASTVTILADAHGMAPEEVETLVAFPIETAMNGASGLCRRRHGCLSAVQIASKCVRWPGRRGWGRFG